MEKLARITEDGREQSLRAHLRAVADRASRNVPSQYQALAHCAGALHDAGKYPQAWQQDLRASRRGRTHALQGAVWVMKNQKVKRKLVPTMAYAIAAHHGELQTVDYYRDTGFEQRAENWEQAIALLQQDAPRLLPDELPADIPRDAVYDREMAVRFLLAAVVDGDRLDARAFDQAARPPKLERSANSSQSPCFNPRPCPEWLQALRERFCQYATDAATERRGIYRLTGPTGVGKTIASLRFACDHDRHHQGRGILYVGPLKSIIEQTASVYREALAPAIVLEHHSGYEPAASEYTDWQHATERWDRYAIVTTGVQFYETLFSNRASKLRKLVGVWGRTIVIDEAQTIPPSLVRPILSVLETLVHAWGCTIVLMSATQPAFHQLGFLEDAIDIVPPDVSYQLTQQLSRVTYRVDLEPQSQAKLAQTVASYERALLVVNTTANARDLFRLVQAEGAIARHYSARMCPAHRQQVLHKVRQRANGEPCILVSTQAIEAGVDVDFPVGFRAIGPLDAIVQTAGRVNREGKGDRADSILHVVNFEGRCDPPNDYRAAVMWTLRYLSRHPEALDPEQIDETIALYYREWMYRQAIDGGNRIQRLRQNYDYPAVAREFAIIDSDWQQSVLVNWGEGAERLASLREKAHLTAGDWRSLQPYTVGIPRNLQTVEELPNGMCIWLGDYDEDCGIVGMQP
ncbi:MAG: CRISPR-associated endonuclease Cas3'' [Spirulinaceae cyanobacterium RM2_2_10]|nr:CRISPR-associated endonuclease Cas3'' [Spirulinaceae cyanobacterium SM2_1_0]NJO19259.1 CRISPR-associated endonuclease Cas3'' [Spirulinaceae cyanobacterium RM2_2_10]